MMSASVCDCSIPISSVAHVVVSLQRALLSEEEQKEKTGSDIITTISLFSFEQCDFYIRMYSVDNCNNSM